jgi:hypothetical protein
VNAISFEFVAGRPFLMEELMERVLFQEITLMRGTWPEPWRRANTQKMPFLLDARPSGR